MNFADKIHRIGSIECEAPQADLYTFNGRLEIGPSFFWSQKQEPSFSDTLRRHRRTLPLTADHLLMRGSRIKNTEWAIGCAIYTGQDTKLAINSQVIRSKMSSSEKFINKFLIFFLVVLITLVTFCYTMKRYGLYGTASLTFISSPRVFILVFLPQILRCTRLGRSIVFG